MIDAQTLANRFCAGENVYDVDASTWKSAFQYIDCNLGNIAFNRSGVHLLWTESGGHLRNKIRDDSLIARILRKALPGYQGPGLHLYRGECQFLYQQGQIGFCWSPKVEVAELFAQGVNAVESGGVLLRAFAPPEAVLAGPNDHSSTQLEEFEYTCDPAFLVRIEAVQIFPKIGGE